MKIQKVAAIVAAAMLATSASAGDTEIHKNTKIEISSDEGDGEVRLVLDSEELGFNLYDMQVGENQSVIDSNGQPVLITRTEDGFTFDVDGKSIDMPAIHDGHDRATWVGRHEFAPDADIDVRVIRSIAGEIAGDIDGEHHGLAMAPHMTVMDGEGVMIVSGAEIDEATQEAIRATLLAAGHEDVTFIGGHDGGRHQVKVVSKVVEVN